MIKNCRLIEPFTCKQIDSIVDVAKKLKPILLRHIFVVDKNEKPIGVISVIDIINRVVAENKDASKLTAKDIMTTPIEVYDINDDEIVVYKKMVKDKRTLCAVTDKDKIVGIIQLGELIKFITMPMQGE